ncbi:MAG: methylated-DNA--[protein]-cysteine S-methyltransferase [Paracoccaceae bacterium]
MDQAYHYGVVARAIAAIDAAPGPLPLDALAAEMSMSPAHLQRVFTAWAGASPHRVGQWLTLGHAKSLLADGLPLMEAAGALNLSGPSRLHDLFVTWEAMTPGEFARGRTLSRGRFETPFGPAWAAGTERGLTALSFEDASALDARYPGAAWRDDPEPLRGWVEAAFGGGEVRAHALGAPFALSVWRALVELPEGSATTYGALAAGLGKPNAARAVGGAVGANPLAWLIPCHRVLRAAGGIGGYRWGLPRKRAMLAWEAARRHGAAAGGAAEGEAVADAPAGPSEAGGHPLADRSGRAAIA